MNNPNKTFTTMGTKENRDGLPAALTAEEVNLRMNKRCATLEKTIYGEHTPAVFVVAGCDDDGWWLDWHLQGVGSHYRLRFRESDLIMMMKHGGTFQGTVNRTPDIIYDITVEAPEGVVIPSNNDEDKQKAQAQQEEPMEEKTRESLVGKMVRVEWHDHCALNDWLRLDQIFAEPLLVVTIGEVVAETDATLVVAATVSNETKFHWPKCNDAQVIVRAAIKNIEVLNVQSLTH